MVNKQQNVVTCVYHLILHRKSLNKGALLYIHLNLAIALLIALVIFVAGIETAITVPVSEFGTVIVCIPHGTSTMMCTI